MADIVVQPKVFALFATAGILCGAIYALIRGLRGTKKRRMWTGLLDLAFCAMAVLIFGVCSAYALKGEIRLFSLAAYATGFFVFYAGPGAALSQTVARTARFVFLSAKKSGDALNRALAKLREDE